MVSRDKLFQSIVCYSFSTQVYLVISRKVAKPETLNVQTSPFVQNSSGDTNNKNTRG